MLHKVLMGLSAVCMALTLVVVPAVASATDDIDQSNNNTGNNSTNRNRHTINKTGRSSIPATSRGVFANGIRAVVLHTESAPPILFYTPLIPAASGGVFPGCSKRLRLRVTNTATVITNLDITARTGNNTSSRNTRGGDLTSGDVTIDFNVDNRLN